MPVVLVEVKPTVGAELRVVQPQHIAQVLVQAYYAMIQYKLPSIMCALTDRVTWHFFKVEMVGDALKAHSSSASSASPAHKKVRCNKDQLLKVVWAKKVSTADKKAVAFMAECLQMN